MARRLILIRHGQVEQRFEGRFIGSTDAALSPAGLRQAQDLATWLAEQRPGVCFCSPLQRCTATARAAVAGLALQPEPDPDLREVDFGAWEGLSFADIAGRDAAAVDRWARCEPGFRFPGGESIADFTGRIGVAAARLAAAPQETVVAFTHGGVIRFMICALLRLEPGSYAAFEIRPAGVVDLALFEGGALLQSLGNLCGPIERPPRNSLDSAPLFIARALRPQDYGGFSLRTPKSCRADKPGVCSTEGDEHSRG